MSAKQKLLDYILNLTPEQVDKVISRLPLLESCLAMADNRAIYRETFTGEPHGGECK